MPSKMRWPFSNFIEIPGGMPGMERADTNRYKTLEHAYQAAKTDSLEERAWVAAASTPGQAKWRGKRVTLREDWASHRYGVMSALVALKWDEEPFRSQLLASGDEPLVEHNSWHDTYWGICDCQKHQGAGQNKLGAILTEQRRHLRFVEANR